LTESIPELPTRPDGANRRVPLRLRLTDPSVRGPLDGSWWPQSRDLTVELRDLIDHFPIGRGAVQRVVYSRPDWDSGLRRLRVGHGQVKVGSYPKDDTHQVWLSMSTRELIRLSVQAPEDGTTPPNPGAAASHEPPRKVADAPEPDGEAAERWTDDGGSGWRPHRAAPSYRT
jgi:hypothetical protein